MSMKAVNALYEHGSVWFLYSRPEVEGPVPVMVVFPPEVEDDLEAWDDQMADGEGDSELPEHLPMSELIPM